MNVNAQLAFKEPSRGGRDNRFRDDLLTTGATPLLRAAQTFDNDVVRLLLERGALVDLPNASGVTPFMAAAGVGTRTGGGVLGPGVPDNVIALSLETMEILRKAGADVNARITDVTSLTARIARANTLTGRQGQTTLFFAAETRTDRGREVSARTRREDRRRGRYGTLADRSGRGCARRPRRHPVQGNCRAPAEGQRDTAVPAD